MTPDYLLNYLDTLRKPRACFFTTKKERGNSMRTLVTLECSECKRRNYTTYKNKNTHPDRLELKKYCRWCRKHTLHKETR